MKKYFKEEIFQGKNYNNFRLLKTVIFSINARFIFLLRLFYWLSHRKTYFLIGFVNRYLVTRFGCYIGRESSIGIGVKFPHPNGIIIGNKTIIGENCIIYQQVTFGGKIQGDAQNGNYPKIGRNVIIYAGAKILGNVEIGDNSIIGANSVVIEDIPPLCIAGGIPTRILKYL